MRLQRTVTYSVVIATLSLVIGSCGVSKYMEPNELLLKSNEVKFHGSELLANKSLLKYELSTFYKQKPNRSFFFIPREWFYYTTLDTTKNGSFKRLQRRRIAERPAIYNPALTEATIEGMLYYLRYSGYYHASVSHTTVLKKKKKIESIYHVDPGQRFIIDSVFYSSPDSMIEKELKLLEKNTPLRSGRPLDLNTYEQEKDRITRSLRNRGYAFFYSNFIAPLVVDTARRSPKANIYLEVNAPFSDSLHQQYSIGEVTIYLDYDAAKPDIQYQSDTLIGGYRFRSAKRLGWLDEDVVLRSTFLKTGALFQQELLDKTYRQLSGLGVFSFVRIRQEADTINRDQLNFRIELTPNSKMEMGVSFDLNYTNRSSSSGSGELLGIAFNPSLRNRNLFGGAELLITSLSAGVEMNILKRQNQDVPFWNTIDLRIQSDLYLPKFVDYLGLWKGLNSIPWGKSKKLLSDTFYQSLKETAPTRISASYNFLLIPDWYQYSLLNASYGYDFQRDPQRRYVINHIGIDYLRPDIYPRFQELVDINPFLGRSFGQQLFVSLLFRDFTFVKTTRPNRARGESSYFGFQFEMAGAELWGINALYNEFALEPQTLKLGDTDFSQYVRTEVDLRYFRNFNPRRSIALRFIAGIARPFGFTTDVPYVKQFYVGGGNSIRGWPQRGLGPGGFLDPLSLDFRNNTRLYQAGDMKFEFNAEYRFDLVWKVKGALFLDGGNVWTLRRDTSRIGSQFLFQEKTFTNSDGEIKVNDPFYKQIALSTGLGVRVDLTYFIFRLDAGVKLRYPYTANPGLDPESAYWENFSTGWGVRDLNFNLALGYPF
ncbi:MAG: BamA/TamA family outer membrane protein [Saprospiraceae bacterium]